MIKLQLPADPETPRPGTNAALLDRRNPADAREERHRAFNPDTASWTINPEHLYLSKRHATWHYNEKGKLRPLTEEEVRFVNEQVFGCAKLGRAAAKYR